MSSATEKTSTVLHIEHTDATRQVSNVLAFKQDENHLKGQQIWWIEPLADYGSEDPKPEDGIVYSITNPGSGRSLDANPGDGNVCTWVHHGEPWQRWRLRRAIDPWQGEVCYNIVSVFNDKVVDTVGDDPPSGARVTLKAFDPARHEHYWDFLISVVAFPSGWLQIENAGTGDCSDRIIFITHPCCSHLRLLQNSPNTKSSGSFSGPSFIQNVSNPRPPMKVTHGASSTGGPEPDYVLILEI